MNKWIAINTPEDIEPKEEEVLVWDGCDYHLDYVDVCADTGNFYMANNTNPTHYKILDNPDE